MKRAIRGFTLIEMLTVITVLSILLLVVMTRVRLATTRAREANLRENLHSMRTALSNFSSDVGGYPTELSQLSLGRAAGRATIPPLDAAGNHLLPDNYKGPYISPDKIPKDPFSLDGSWGYDPTEGHVYTKSTRIALDHTAYADW